VPIKTDELLEDISTFISKCFYENSTDRAVTILPTDGKPDAVSSAASLDTSVSCISKLASILPASNLSQKKHSYNLYITVIVIIQTNTMAVLMKTMTFFFTAKDRRPQTITLQFCNALCTDDSEKQILTKNSIHQNRSKAWLTARLLIKYKIS